MPARAWEFKSPPAHMDINIFKLIGALGLIMISVGLLLKKRVHQDVLYILGGICLEMYSLYLRDTVFIVLQIVFVVNSTLDLFRVYKTRD